MNIAFLTTEYPHVNTGSSAGLGTSIFNLAHALNSQNIKVSIFIYGQEEDNIFYDNQIKIIQIRNIKIKGLSWWLTRKKIEMIVNRHVVQYGVEILEVADWTGISAWLKIRCPIIMRLHGSDSFFCNLENRPVKKWNYLQERLAYKKASRIIAVSQFVGIKTNEVFQLNKTFHVIPNCIDLQSFNGTSQLTSNESGIILYFGTIIRKKGALDIPQIFNRIHKNNKNAKLILVGGDTVDVLTGYSSTWNLMKQYFTRTALNQVDYIGKVPYSEIQDCINKADVCIFPSYAEAMPVSWLEAMAMGKAIVASNIGWASEMIDDGKEGFLVHPSQHETFANRILEILTNSKLKTEIGEKARLRVKTEFSTELIVKRNLEFYKN